MQAFASQLNLADTITVAPDTTSKAYPIVIGSLFILQAVICVGILHWGDRAIKQAQLRNAMQKADFYTNIYSFHVQITEEEKIMNQQLAA